MTKKQEAQRYMEDADRTQGYIVIKPGIWLATSALMQKDQKDWSSEDVYADYDFTQAPYFITTDDGQMLPICTEEDLEDYVLV